VGRCSRESSWYHHGCESNESHFAHGTSLVSSWPIISSCWSATTATNATSSRRGIRYVVLNSSCESLLCTASSLHTAVGAVQTTTLHLIMGCPYKSQSRKVHTL
jgi:hypothetical protein